MLNLFHLYCLGLNFSYSYSDTDPVLLIFVDIVICPMILQRDGEDMVELVRNCQNEFKEYYIQMQAAKRSQAPHPSQVMSEPF